MPSYRVTLSFLLVAVGACDGAGDFVPVGSIEPAAFELGPLTRGTTCQAELAVKNEGNVDLAVRSGALTDDDGDWELVKFPTLVRTGASEALLVRYTAEGDEGVLESATIELLSDDPDAGGLLTGSISAITTEATAATTKTSCGPGDAPVSPCPGLSYGFVQVNGSGLVLSVTLLNDGTADMEVEGARFGASAGSFSIDSVVRGSTVIELPTTVPPGRSTDCGAPTGNANSITFNLRFTPTELGAAVDELVIDTNAVNDGGEVTVPLDGAGSDTGIVISPETIDFGALGEGDVETLAVRVENIGTNTASVNFSCIDLENDGVCEADCTGQPDDVALGGTLSCVVTTAAGGVEGKGFVLGPTDAAAGGDDERVISVTWAPVAGATAIPATAVLALHSNILGSRVFVAPLLGGQ